MAFETLRGLGRFAPAGVEMLSPYALGACTRTYCAPKDSDGKCTRVGNRNGNRRVAGSGRVTGDAET